jgi:hypothetical protein
MAYGTNTVAGGTTGTLADIPVATDTVAGAVFERTKDTDPTEGASIGIGIDSNPKRVRPRRRGTSDYDSGNVAIAASAPAAVIGSTVYPEGGLVVNPTDGPIVVTLTDGSDVTFFKKRVDGPDVVTIPLTPGASLPGGWKAGADLTGARAMLWGAQ